MDNDVLEALMPSTDLPDARDDAVQALFAGPGEMRARCRTLDWSATALGPVAEWPAALRTAVRLCLDAAFPIAIHAGDAQVLIYNDCYRTALGTEKHPWALGRPAGEVWPAMSVGVQTPVRVRAEAALRESEARFHAVVDLVPDLLWQIEPDGSTSWYNARCTEYTGHAPGSTERWQWTDAIHPADRERSMTSFARIAERGDALIQQHRIRRHDGAYRWFLVRAEPLHDSEGKILCWFGSATDIHMQRMALDEVELLVAERTAERDVLRRQLVEAEEAERRRLSRELHDQLGQELTAFRLGLDDAIRLAAATAYTDPSMILRLRRLSALALRMTDGARSIALELRPPELDDVGFGSALQTYVQEWSVRYGVPADVAFARLDDDESLRSDLASALYRIAQEGLNNIAKHAQARRVSVLVDKSDAEVRLVIEDDGCGFDPDAAATFARSGGRFGLAGMRERAAIFGGSVGVESSPGAGSTVYVRLPLAAAPPTRRSQ